ncbi:single-stranded DNA-binding protein [Desulfovibrio sp.]|uniref:single-stranded DNA-binding protein n=1 Tax=Desulfovibrio sp. TaxID=885 RepID=UPI0025BD259C|nr:single-stranded DNA-binding protein [Desulfovibrio sp.]
MLNKVMIIGRLGRDPELRYTQSGSPVASLNIATGESYTDRDGNKVDRTEWHRVSVFQRQAENCANYLTKGSLVYVEGSLQTRKWQDQQGQDRYTTEIKAQRVQFLDRKGDAPRGEGSGGGGGGRGYEDDYGAAAPRGNAPRGGQGAPRQQSQGNRRPADEDLGPAFPSEASNMDEVPF